MSVRVRLLAALVALACGAVALTIVVALLPRSVLGCRRVLFLIALLGLLTRGLSVRACRR